eukprot:CAMPEP_0201723224 /NCGR_PEP_ID=MMETSP0593-20130828/7349_1 /ASSEMBLY_ACC=CAM_ASM_000672 /TAXON_ID=267983 /ORGANISM="Skeletonema japonicum, Strain CCMP2506" /LENGTH=680 /DNA_ID=CAMNT_0048214301 /DNA_START=215 /DNA_END=2253 /DNA_ORIENTATION=+
MTKQSKEDQVDTKDNDFQNWAKGLVNWGTAGGENNNQNDNISFDSFPFSLGRKSNNNKIWESEMTPVVASMSGMVNVEALIAAANKTDDDVMTLMPDLQLLTTQASAESREDSSEASTTSSDDEETNNAVGPNVFPFLENALRWDELIQIPLLQRNVQEFNDILTSDDMDLNVTFDDLVNLVPPQEGSTVNDTSTDEVTEQVLQDATQRLDLIINSVSSTFSPSTIQNLILRASKSLALQEASGNLTAIFEAAGNAPRATAQYTAELLQYANGVLAEGYTPLFQNYASFEPVSAVDQKKKIVKAAEFGALSGAIYDDAIPKATEIGHSVVAQGKTAEIGWMVTDSLQDLKDFAGDETTPTLVRTIVLRGYDASDEDVDREGLLNTICTASPVSLFRDDKSLVKVHEGMLYIAELLMREIEPFIESTAPSHKIVFAGHSIGGALSILLMILLTKSRGTDFVTENVLRVFTFGSPPIFSMDATSNLKRIANDEESDDYCSILGAFDLPRSIVYSYSQPWDPIPRLYTSYDPLYPLIDDLGDDGYTPWVSGPPRTLRPIVKTILENWEGWPSYRENMRSNLGQDYRSVGEQFLLLPEPIRYLTDRLVSVNTAVPEIDAVYSISSRELLPALAEVFTLETLQISLVPVAIRSFIHHFYPAYDAPFVAFASSLEENNASESDDSR